MLAERLAEDAAGTPDPGDWIVRIAVTIEAGRRMERPLSGVKVYLRNQVTGAVVARTVTGGDGTFTFRNVPADLYDFGIVGPWKMVYSDPEFAVRDGENGPVNEPYNHWYYVVPGPYQPDPDPAPPTGGHAKPAPGPAPVVARPVAPHPPGLATTGVGITWLALSALLTTMTGASPAWRASPTIVVESGAETG